MTVDLGWVVTALERHYGRPSKPTTTDPFEMVLVENVAYLADDEERRSAMDRLAESVGLDPLALAKAPLPKLERVASAGILASTFAAKLRACGRIALEEFEGDVGSILELPDPKAIKALRKFPGIGLPGAEKILLFAGSRPFLAPDSNGLRVLNRLGLVGERRSYGATYEAARPVTAHLGDRPDRLKKANLLLRTHGKTLCRRTRPQCGACPLNQRCPSASKV